MPDPRLLQVLRLTHFLRDVPDEALEAAAAQLEIEEYASGEDIVTQGAGPQALHFVLQGSVDQYRRDSRGHEQHLATLGAGDALDEVEVTFRLPYQASSRAAGACTVARWDRTSLSAFLKPYPSATANLRFAASSRQLASKLRFSWLAEGEVVYAAARKHTFLLYQSLTFPALMLFAALVMGLWASNAKSGLIGWIAGGLGLLAIAFGIWRYLDWGNDYYVVTDRRAVWIEKVIGLYDSRREAPLHMVLSVSLRTDAVSRSIGYGDVIIRTYTGQVAFRNVANPQAMAAMVEEHWRRLQHQRQQADRETLSRTLHEQVGSAPAAEPSPLPLAAERTAQETGLGHWTFQVRFEEKGVITYRKHWAVLLQAIALPSVLVLAAAGLLGTSMSGSVRLLSDPLALLVFGGLLAASGVWWLYQYVDWANDIYQVTPTQIVDVTRKPLGSERREVAPLENILGTEVDRKGILGLLLNYGSVVANIGTAEFRFDGVFDPVGVQQDIVRAQEAIVARKRQAELGERREEMVELINLYHEEIASRRPGTDAEGGRPDAQS